jgi:hypothetical protein
MTSNPMNPTSPATIAGTGNDIALFTSVPEPGTAGQVGLMMLGLISRRRSDQRAA